MPRRSSLCLAAFALLLSLAGSAAEGPQSLNETYVAIAHAVYEDSLLTARELQGAIDGFLDNPTEENLAAARAAWRRARVPYLQSEVFRFSNQVVDDWEPQVNAWPLDEGLIDYVADDYFHELGNIGATLNIVANPTLEAGGTELDAREITPQLLAELHELGGSEANVTTGYHAIEFLLWGQDLNGTAPGAGERPASDYRPGEACTHGHCERRREYLRAATALLIDDLQTMVEHWAPERDGNYRQQLLAADPNIIRAKIFFSMGSLALGEVSGERMKVALEANSTEDEHDCFSDNTHWSHYYDVLGLRNLYQGEYQRVDGSRVSGPSVADLAAKNAPELHRQMVKALDRSLAAVRQIVEAAEDEGNPVKFDQMIAEGNRGGALLIREAINALVRQTATLEQLAQALGVDPNVANRL